MNQYLLDTNTCIYIINKKPENVYQKFKKVSLDNIFISTITEFELKYGVQKSQKPDQNQKTLNEFLGYLNIIPFDSEAASIAGSIRTRLEKKGEIIGPYDLLIASQAIANDIIIVTNNEKEFKRIKELKIENWIN
ncbi:type II toxin-antitoxin system VapC family toxin [Leptospira sp. 2 VSF19]|uniref:Type II toxin-antitoxin system VapC family toxin n=1 Tax=Leptospira soteropolitanensis TaxID=2950025 RepID=A0AAW5VQE4_9LEPT|nr:type II toxin-antitoxin system VapC family toxin [Leptospira soteropolitanensis]MCW7494708.1 type II toxin-antitoxin system VapC family toxin [Leptospira soteropolitanensis]MCW7502309.1 type II toxin-antitoxin system VapC family toxin [Leptospira soteropolitanensis]MCW7524537.1 type II toxin-antitoxin system VapC family toxin [Leptospira soteropolitanensis]MCW7528407.1 type II toxin-antitoxin system VapC family toxin [Leptospira soteropolitanensis]MCW7532267.1 type II toxin-antitoxin system